MKNCPFCKAEIEDTARFCLYCMRSLTEKERIIPRKNYRWLMLAAATLALAALMTGVGFALGHRDAPAPSEGPSMEQTGQTQEQTLSTEQTAQTQPEDVPATTDDVPTVGQIPNQPVRGQSTTTGGTTPPAGITGPAAQPTTSPTTGSTVPPTIQATVPTEDIVPGQTTPSTTVPGQTTPSTTVPEQTAPSTTVPEQTEATTEPTEEEVEETTYPPDYGNGIPGTEGYRTQRSIMLSDPAYDEQEPFSDGGYCLSYEFATANDLMDPTYVNTAADLVVSGKGASTRNGIYIVASYGSSGKVVAIRNARLEDAVKLIVPDTVVAIGAYALCNNYEFKYLCLQGDLVTIHPDAFPPMEKRWYTIVIRCSASCKNSDGEYIKDIVGRYGAVWEEWNG